MSTSTAGLNTAQNSAVTNTDGPLLVLAGAGTGKTRVITHRIARLLSKRVPASAILAMTFTNKAAAEMRTRIRELVPARKAEGLTIGTFHSFCVRALREHADRLDLHPNFGICDSDDQLVVMKQALRELQIPEAELPPRLCLARVSLLKSRMISPETLQSGGNGIDNDIGRAYARYDAGLRTSRLMDFDDLLLYMVKLLGDKTSLRAFQKRFQYLLIDEYQDTNAPQYEIVRRIGAVHRNVCVVGDDDQSIYGWRGADMTKILNFEKDFPKAVVVRLETNYRSTPQIVAGANLVIRNNPGRHEKTLRAHDKDGEAIRIKRLLDEEAEAAFVVDDIAERVRSRRMRLGQFAILFRTAVQPRIIEMQLRQHGMPYRLVGGMSFFDHKEVRDILSYLRLVANPSDELSLLRVINTPPRGIGASTVEKMMSLAAQQRASLVDVLRDESTALRPTTRASVDRFLGMLDSLRRDHPADGLVDLLKDLIRSVNYGEEIKRCYSDSATRTKRWDAVNEILNMAEVHGRQRSEATLTTFLEEVALSANDDRDDDRSSDDEVTLMTLHSAKGLEFGEVYLVGMEEGLLPHLRSIQDGGIEEERRLAYVGITRARHRLTLSYVQSRARYGNREASLPSRFLYEVQGKEAPAELMEHISRIGTSVANESAPATPRATGTKKGKPNRKPGSKRSESKPRTDRRKAAASKKRVSTKG